MKIYFFEESAMPLFEFHCTNCEKPFEELVRSASAVDEVHCPICGGTNIKKKISMFASKVTGGNAFSQSIGSSASCSTGSA